MFCHFRISIAGSPSQKVVFQLHNDKCPKTCDNFIALCQSSATAKRPSSSSIALSSSSSNIVQRQPPTYRGTEFHRILPKFMIQGGDFTNFDGTGGHAAPTITNNAQSQSTTTFPDENFDISHDREGILSMANKGKKNTNGSQFFITLGKTLHLDGKHVAFGRVVRGMEVVREASHVETEGSNGRPGMLQRVVIVDCGIGMGDDDDDDEDERSDDSSSSDSLEEDGGRQRKKRSSSKKKRRSRKEEDYESQHRKRKKRKSHDGSRSRSKHRNQKEKKKRKEKSSHRRRSREDSTSSEEDERERHDDDHHHNSRSSKKRRKRDRVG